METILITGGSRGIGAAVARAAVGSYNVAIFFNRSEDAAKKLVEKLSAKGAIAAFKCDVADAASVKSAVKAVKERFGKIDVLVNAAGIAQSKLFIDLTLEDWHSMFAVNVDGVFNVTSEVLPDMLSRQKGSIVNVSSIWGVEGASMETAYSASKAAIIGLTKALAKEVAPSGVRVNAVAPGAIDTDMMKCYTQDELEGVCQSVPLGRLGKSEEVASAILFAAECGYATGSVLAIDGGGIF